MDAANARTRCCIIRLAANHTEISVATRAGTGGVLFFGRIFFVGFWPQNERPRLLSEQRPLMALSGHGGCSDECLLLAPKRT
jgi:hypothetical protein